MRVAKDCQVRKTAKRPGHSPTRRQCASTGNRPVSPEQRENAEFQLRILRRNSPIRTRRTKRPSRQTQTGDDAPSTRRTSSSRHASASPKGRVRSAAGPTIWFLGSQTILEPDPMQWSNALWRYLKAEGQCDRLPQTSGCDFARIQGRCAPLAQLNRASASGAEGCRFEPCRGCHTSTFFPSRFLLCGDGGRRSVPRRFTESVKRKDAAQVFKVEKAPGFGIIPNSGILIGHWLTLATFSMLA